MRTAVQRSRNTDKENAKPGRNDPCPCGSPRVREYINVKKSKRENSNEHRQTLMSAAMIGRVSRGGMFLRVTVGMAVAVAVYRTAAFYGGAYEPSTDFERLWGAVFAVLLAAWVDEDSRGREDVALPSFDLGMFVFLIWILFLPWYLLRTRGAKGWLWMAGLFALAFLGPVLQLLIYAANGVVGLFMRAPIH